MIAEQRTATDPTPDEIAARCREIRESWDESTEWLRRVGWPQTQKPPVGVQFVRTRQERRIIDPEEY